MEYLDFVTENYIWFILGAVVILMTVIGYFAEKTQFGKKKTSEKEKKAEKKDKLEAIIASKEEPEEVLFQDVMPVADTEVSEEPMESLDDRQEELEATTKETDSEEIPEELYAGLDGTPNTYKETSEDDNLDMDLPNIETLKDDIDLDNPEDDDMWRF